MMYTDIAGPVDRVVDTLAAHSTDSAIVNPLNG
jgi:hypothetical protein